KYYTYGTGGNPLVSDDGWTWRRGVTPARTGAAPDVIHIGDRYFMYISGVTMISSKTLDPDSPDYKWEDGGRIADYESPDDFINPIDPGAFLDPTDMIYHDGWYYLLGTHGSCCAGAASGYNIRVGRSRKVTGPFLDNMGVD